MFSDHSKTKGQSFLSLFNYTPEKNFKEVPCLLTCLRTKSLVRLVKDEGNSLGKFARAYSLSIAKNTIVPTEFTFINLVAGYFEGKCIPSSLYLEGIQ